MAVGREIVFYVFYVFYVLYVIYFNHSPIFSSSLVFSSYRLGYRVCYPSICNKPW